MRTVLRDPEPFSPETATGAFRVAITDYAATLVITAWNACVRPEAPLLDLELVPFGPTTAEEGIRGELDLAIAGTDVPGIDDRYIVKPFLAETFVSVVRRGHPLSRHKVSLSRFAALDHVLVAALDHVLVVTGSGQVSSVDRKLQSRGLARRIARASLLCGSQASIARLGAPHRTSRAELLDGAACGARQRRGDDIAETFCRHRWPRHHRASTCRRDPRILPRSGVAPEKHDEPTPPLREGGVATMGWKALILVGRVRAQPPEMLDALYGAARAGGCRANESRSRSHSDHELHDDRARPREVRRWATATCPRCAR
ncbi:MAG: hypothetical protein JRI98_11575 [Deltaproteobacteria bacterium]|nr:hypothetical protein [Deltaproteobacteria bacterium]